jgi:hypothetical protein
LCAVLNARYDLPSQVQMQLQMSGAGAPAEVYSFLEGVKDGDFDDLL